MVAEHLDHLHYLNDILLLEIKDLNAVLTEHLLHKLFVPLYIFSLTPTPPPPPPLAIVTQNLAAVLKRSVDIDIHEMQNPRVSSIVALYLLSLVFLVVTHAPLVHALAWVILNGDNSVFKEGAAAVLNAYVDNREAVIPSFAEPRESLEQALASSSGCSSAEEPAEDTTIDLTATEHNSTSNADPVQTDVVAFPTVKLANITDEEKQELQQQHQMTSSSNSACIVQRPFLDFVLLALDCSENDYLALLSLCLIYAMSFNKGCVRFFHIFINAIKHQIIYS